VIIIRRKAIMETKIGIFRGKQKANNIFLLETLYNSGPLTAWELTRKVREKNLMSLHAIFSKRLRRLAKKGYVKKAGKKWSLQFKAIIAVLTIQEEPKPWNPKWTEIFENYISPLKDAPKRYVVTADGKEIGELKDFVLDLPKFLKDFQAWVVVAKEAKRLMEKGLVNFDVITNETLGILLVSEVLTKQNQKFSNS
jgi:sporulation protein YlmC with PRC-barrel domain